MECQNLNRVLHGKKFLNYLVFEKKVDTLSNFELNYSLNSVST